jgi:hypothetical protein
MLICVPKITARTNYVFDHVFGQMGIEYEETTDTQYFNNYSAEKINYSTTEDGQVYFIEAAPLLSEEIIKAVDPGIEWRNNIPYLFPNKSALGFDVFAAIFFMISRYEEYLPYGPDRFGRYNASDSFAVKNKFIHLPVVDIWIEELKKSLRKTYPFLVFKERKFEAILTYDIDVAFAYKGRGLTRNIAAIAKDITKFRIENLVKRLMILSGIETDPWDIYAELRQQIINNKIPAIFFFLLGNYSDRDKNLPYTSTSMKKLTNEIASFSEIGIHPSFNSTEEPVKIKLEKLRLEKLTGKIITKSRQHYLKFKLPDTYNELIRAGITEDYSMGFPEMPGFRAGTCLPYYFYDLKNENATTLKIFPITCMEGSLKEYLYLTPDAAQTQILALIDEVKKVNGIFISIWHNHTISNAPEYIEWKKVHDEMIYKLRINL